MASGMTEIAATLLIFACVVQGTQSLQIEHEESLNATVGQNIRLPCIVAEKHEKIINQIEWHAEREGLNKKLVVFNPQFSTHYNVPVQLQLVYRTSTTKIQGSILHLYNVTEEDSGIYVCEISTFPDGSFKVSTKVQFTEPWVSVKVVSPDKSLIEGDEVNITCLSNPLADKYKLLSLQSNWSLESQSGQFTIQNVTRHSRDLICRPLWTSSNQHLHSLRENVQLTVDFLDSIDCNSSSQIEVETGTNLTITCEAKSSRSLHYIWMKGNVTVAQNATISLWSVNPDHSGMYSVIVYARNHSRLQRQRDFQVTVLNRTDAEQHLSSTITVETTSQITEGTTLTTAGPGTTPTVTTQAGRVSSTAFTTSTATGLYGNTTTPSAGSISTSQANLTTAHANVTSAHPVESNSTSSASLYASAERSTLSEGCCLWQNITSSPGSTRKKIIHAHTNASTTIFTSTSISKSTLTTEKNVQEYKHWTFPQHAN
ncbi:nectin-1 isoform X2 [Salminus brasiliensis]|uniref:nectin-1 isoform X2 n=1 Tax=Salminus brasiliensis TaxID=930266 RepID=UPI003B838693